MSASMGKQDSINTSISLGRNKRESACMGSGKGESRVQWRNKTQVCVCISIHVHAVPVLLHFVVVLYLCERVVQRREERKRGRNIYL